MKVEIEGSDAIAATEELLAIEELEGSYEVFDEVEREVTLTTIATVVAIAAGTMTIAEKLYQWREKYQRSLQNPSAPKIEKVLLVGKNGRRLLLKDATIEQIKDILDD